LTQRPRLGFAPPQVLAELFRQPLFAVPLLVVRHFSGLPHRPALDKTALMSKARGFPTMLL
jgi:hypothetical protein